MGGNGNQNRSGKAAFHDAILAHAGDGIIHGGIGKLRFRRFGHQRKSRVAQIKSLAHADAKLAHFKIDRFGRVRYDYAADGDGFGIVLRRGGDYRALIALGNDLRGQRAAAAIHRDDCGIAAFIDEIAHFAISAARLHGAAGFANADFDQLIRFGEIYLARVRRGIDIHGQRRDHSAVCVQHVDARMRRALCCGDGKGNHVALRAFFNGIDRNHAGIVFQRVQIGAVLRPGNAEAGAQIFADG